ncbi:hypothetical protein [Bacillus sp. X1(2014)]|uniref:hypothetical protein n=1 Tax=Bacillus sp. X1(2014) TaxID=1565991 RepID=UPI0011A6F15B|nr:hypothetical protein [Bacillus sp. X1(2014)]
MKQLIRNIRPTPTAAIGYIRLNSIYAILIKRLVEWDASTESEAITTKGDKKIVEIRSKIPQEITLFSTKKD